MIELPGHWIEPLAFGDGRSLPCRVFPGPMDGVSESSFVSALSSRGWVRMWHTPFLRISTGVPRMSRLRNWLADYQATGLPVIAQVMGTDGGRLAATGGRLHQLAVSCVDVNCACPSPTVVRNQSGGARLKHPEWICDTIHRLQESCGNKGVSVKIRIGFESATEFPRIAEALRECRPDIVFLHFRTVLEMYGPVPGGWERFRMARELLEGLTLIGCGDVCSVEDASRLASICPGLDGISVARGLLRDPLLLRRIEHGCGGELVDGAGDALEFLLEIARESGRPLGADNGFVLKLARAMFGGEHEHFLRIADARNVGNTISYLEGQVRKQAQE